MWSSRPALEVGHQRRHVQDPAPATGQHVRQQPSRQTSQPEHVQLQHSLEALRVGLAEGRMVTDPRVVHENVHLDPGVLESPYEPLDLRGIGEVRGAGLDAHTRLALHLGGGPFKGRLLPRHQDQIVAVARELPRQRQADAPRSAGHQDRARVGCQATHGSLPQRRRCSRE